MPAPRLPAWAQVADLVAVALIVTAVIIEVFGGFHVALAGLRVSIGDPFRLVAWAALVALIRHAFVRALPLHRRVRRALDWIQRPDAVRGVLPPFLVTRLGVLAVGYLAVATIGFPSQPPFEVWPDARWNLLARFDAGWYLDIAEHGYRWAANGSQQNIAFFPAYPLLMRFGGVLLGGHPMLAGFLVSLVAFFWAMLYVYRLARWHGSEDTAAAAVVFLACYPFAVFFSAVYSESLYLLATAGAVYALERRRLAAAAAWALLAGFTRANGFLLAVPLALLVVAQPLRTNLRLPAWLTGRRLPDEPSPRLVTSLAVCAMPVVGLLIFFAYLRHLTGTPLAWFHVQEAWGRTGFDADLLLLPLSQRLRVAAMSAPFQTMNAAAAVFALALTIPVIARLGVAYGALVLVGILPPLLNGGYISVGRYSSVLFPLFVWLGGAVPREHRTVWVAAFAFGQALVACLFFTWRPLF